MSDTPHTLLLDSPLSCMLNPVKHCLNFSVRDHFVTHLPALSPHACYHDSHFITTTHTESCHTRPFPAHLLFTSPKQRQVRLRSQTAVTLTHSGQIFSSPRTSYFVFHMPVVFLVSYHNESPSQFAFVHHTLLPLQSWHFPHFPHTYLIFLTSTPVHLSL